MGEGHTGLEPVVLKMGAFAGFEGKLNVSNDSNRCDL